MFRHKVRLVGLVVGAAAPGAPIAPGSAIARQLTQVFVTNRSTQSDTDPDIVQQRLQCPRKTGPLDRLTTRERQLLALMAEGRSNAAITERLMISPKTVEGHVSRIFTKLDLEPAVDDHRRVLAVLAHLRG